MIKIFARLKGKESKQIFTLLSGTSIGQIIPFLASPVLTRLYSPESYGELGVIMAIVSIFSVIATFRYEESIMLPANDSDAMNLLVASLVLCLFTSITFFSISALIPEQISVIFDFPKFQDWLIVIVFMIFLSGVFNSLLVWTNRKKRYRRLAIRSIEQSTIGVGSKIILGNSILASSGLVLGTLASSFFSTISLLLKTIHDDKRNFLSSVNFKKIKKLLIQYQDFPKYNLPHSFFDVLNASSILLIISNNYGLRAVGLYSFTAGILKKPTRLIAQSLSQVYYQKLAQVNSSSLSMYKDVLNVFKLSLIIGLIIFAPVLLFSQKFFPLIFGGEWINMATVCQVLVPSLFLQFIITPLTYIPIIANEQRKWMFLSLIFNIIFPGTLLLVHLIDVEFTQALLVASIVTMLYQIMLVYWIINIVK